MGQFADIRPYNDDEVAAVVARIGSDPELIKALASLKFGAAHRHWGWLLYPLIGVLLRRQLRSVQTVAQFQTVVKGYMDAMIENHTSRFSVSGLDALTPGEAYLFISNHRDIALDPAFVNYALYHNGHDTVRIAIGDNLLTKPYVSDLMRLNKSFIVKRSAKGPRQVMATYKLLSGYIRHSIEVDKNPIWIAQREGRAKDGVDATEPAIIKMLSMSMDKQSEQFADHIRRLNIVPVAISYEYDPCDAAKARELYARQQQGFYQKGEHEDVESIAKGIAGEKGHVHVAFGQPLRADFVDADSVADAIDQQIISNYVLHPTNFIAYKMLHGEYPSGLITDEQHIFSPQDETMQHKERAFQARMALIEPEHRPLALAIYANVVDRKKALHV